MPEVLLNRVDEGKSTARLDMEVSVSRAIENENLHPFLHQSIRSDIARSAVRVRCSCFIPAGNSTVLRYTALYTARSMLHVALACRIIFPICASGVK